MIDLKLKHSPRSESFFASLDQTDESGTSFVDLEIISLPEMFGRFEMSNHSDLSRNVNLGRM